MCNCAGPRSVCFGTAELHCAVIVSDKFERLSEMAPWVKPFVCSALTCQQRSISSCSSQRGQRDMWGLWHSDPRNAATIGYQAVSLCFWISEKQMPSYWQIKYKRLFMQCAKGKKTIKSSQSWDNLQLLIAYKSDFSKSVKWWIFAFCHLLHIELMDSFFFILLT